VTALDGDSVRLADGTAVTPDAVICATGYRPGLEPMVGHLDVLDGRGEPRVRGAVTPAGADRLFFVGVSVQLGGLIREIGAEALAVAAAIDGRPAS
jgi:hypothetical protein